MFGRFNKLSQCASTSSINNSLVIPATSIGTVKWAGVAVYAVNNVFELIGPPYSF